MEKKKRDWGKVAAILCVVLLALNLWQVRQISDLRVQLSNVNGNVRVWTEDIKTYTASRFSDLESEDQLVQNWSYTPSVNMEKRCLDVEISVVLKEWGEDSAAELVWEIENGGSDSGSVTLSGDGAGTFTGTLELPLDELWTDYGLYTIIRNGETRHRESLGLLGSAGELLPVQCFGWGSGGPDYTRNADKTGVLTVSGCEVNLSGFEGREDLPQLSGQVFRLRRNEEIAAEGTAMYGETIGQYTCEELSSEAQIGDELILTFFCRDESGLGYEFFLDCWAIDDNGIGARRAPAADWPRLTWD